jgi:hypothetical protein
MSLPHAWDHYDKAEKADYQVRKIYQNPFDYHTYWEDDILACVNP